MERSPRSTLLRRTAVLACVLAGLVAAGPAAAYGDDVAGRTCLSITGVTAFAPRGQIYVEVRASCSEEDFVREDPILAYLEVLVGDLPSVGQDVRVYPDAPRRRLTFVFNGLDLVPGDHVLVRLERFGDILGLQSVLVP